MRRTALLSAWALTSLALILPAPLALPTASADVVHLKDGTQIEGDVRKTDAGWSVRAPDGKVTHIDAGRVKSFEARRSGTSGGGAANGGAAAAAAAAPGAAAPPAAADPMQRLLSLRRTIEGMTDIPKVLERYRKFVEQYVGTPAADEALKDLEMWERRLEQGMTKVGDRWVTRQEQGELHEQGLQRAGAARRLLVQGRLKDATAVIDSALAENPLNAAALYLRGVVLFRQDQTANARKAFEASAQLAPNHGPTLNNIAVIMWGTKQYPGALNYYAQAMNAAPGTRQVLDNVAEALNELPQAQRDSPATKKVVLLFNAQDMALQGRMKKRGLLRWGSTWVEEKELKQLQADEERSAERLETLESEFEQVQDRIEALDRDIADTERSIRRIEATSYGRDSSGRAVRLSYPRLYYDLKRDLEQLHADRDGEDEKVVRLRKKARQVKQEVAVPRYAGVQQIIGVEGAPELPPLASDELDEKPATAPTTAPATAPG